MDDLWKRFGLQRFNAVAHVLDDPESKMIVRDLHRFVSVMYYRGFKKSLPQTLRELADLNTTILTTAMESAYFDLRSTESIHLHDKGPSSSKFGAALACWIGRMKPIQFSDVSEHSLENANSEKDMALKDMALVNAIFALVVGRCYKWHLRTGTQQAQVVSQVGRDDRMDEIIYHLAWRSPDFRELIPIFQYL